MQGTDQHESHFRDFRSNGNAVVLGGRRMGKSVFLRQLKAELERHPGTRVVLPAAMLLT